MDMETESTSLVEALIHLAADPIFIADRQGNLIAANHPACQLLGYTPQELLGRNLIHLIRRDQSAALATSSNQSELLTYLHKNGDLIPARVKTQTLADGRWVACICEGYDRAQFQKELSTQTEKLQLALEFGGIGSWDWDVQTNRVTWDKTHFELLGLTPGAFPVEYDTWRERVHPEDLEIAEMAVRIALETQTTYEAEYRVIHPDGSIHWVIGRGRAVYDEAGDPMRMVGVLLDTTERKRAELNEQFLNNLERQLRRLPNAEAMAYEAVSQIGQYLQVDRSMWDYLDPTGEFATIVQDWRRQADIPSNLGTYRISDYILPEMVEVLHNGQPVVITDVVTHPYTTPFAENLLRLNMRSFIGVPCVYQGRWVATLNVTSQTVRAWRSDEVALLQKIVAQLWSIIDQTRASEALRETQQRFVTLAEVAPVVIFQFNAAHECIYINPYWSELTGQPAEAALGSGWIETLHPEDRDRLTREWFAWAQTARQQGLYHNEGRLICPNGDERWYYIQALPLVDADVVIGYIGTLTNMTERKQAEQERERLLFQEQSARQEVESLNQLNQLKDEFLSTVSHELRSPMANIKMVTTLLQVALGLAQLSPELASQELILSPSQTQKVKQYLEILNQECQRELNLINDLLDLARLEAGNALLSPTEIYLQLWIPSVVESFIGQMQQQQQQLQVSVPPDLPPLMIDLPSLERIISELVHNACKYTPPLEVIQITASAYANQIEIKVSNSGVEIPIDLCDRIFDKFYRIPKNDQWKHGGTGLGLALVKKLVESLQGSISVTSQQNCTQFTVILPMGMD